MTQAFQILDKKQHNPNEKTTRNTFTIPKDDHSGTIRWPLSNTMTLAEVLHKYMLDDVHLHSASLPSLKAKRASHSHTDGTSMAQHWRQRVTTRATAGFSVLPNDSTTHVWAVQKLNLQSSDQSSIALPLYHSRTNVAPHANNCEFEVTF